MADVAVDAAGVVARCFDTLRAHDSEAARACFHDNADFWPTPTQHLKGKAAIKAALDQFLDMMSDFKIGIDRRAAQDDLVFNERIDRFTIAGKPMSADVCGAFEVRDGLISYWRDYLDPASMNPANSRDAGAPDRRECHRKPRDADPGWVVGDSFPAAGTARRRGAAVVSARWHLDSGR